MPCSESQRDHQPSIQPEIVDLSPLDEIPETQLSANPPLVAAGEPICENVVNNDEAGSTITKKRNRKRPMKLQGGPRKRSKNEPPNSAHHDDGELTSEIEVGSVNRVPEAAGAKTGTFKIDSVNVVTEVSIY